MSDINLGDIARHLRLSVATVSRALNPSTAHLISAPVRISIQNTADRMGYRPHSGGRPRSQRMYTIGIVVATSFGSPFFSDYLSKVVEGIYSVLKNHKRYGCKLVMLPREKSLSEVDRYIISSEVDGLIISTQCDLSVDELYSLAERLQSRLKRQVIAMNLPSRKRSPISVVSYDNRKAARRAVQHLLKRGCHCIGLLYADNNAEDIRERIEGYKDALAAQKIPLQQELLIKGEFSTSSGYRAVRKLLNKHPRINALFCVNDEMAIGALAAIRDAGKQCPENIAVMGFDGLEVGELVHPRLSTIAQPVAEMAAFSTKLLINSIEGKRPFKRSYLLPVKLLLRDSA